MPDPDAALHQVVPGKYKPADRTSPPAATGTLADVIEQGPELHGARPAGPDSFAPPPSAGALFNAARVQSRAYRTDFSEIMLRDGYAPIVDALGLGASENPARFYDFDPQTEARLGPLPQPSTLATSARRGESILGNTYMATRPLQEELVAQQIRDRRAKDKNFLPGVPDTVDGLHQYFREQEARKRHAASSTIARSSGLTDALTVFAGSGFETFHDPFNIATLPIGGGGKTLLQTVGRETLVNGVVEALQLPVAAKNLDELGEHLTGGEAVSDVVTAGVFGGALGGTFHVAGAHVPPLVFKAMPESVQARWAGRMKIGDVKLTDILGDMDNRELAGFARSTVGERMTPDEKAAANVLEREQDLGEASPFEAGPEGDAAHQAGLGNALQAIIDGAPGDRGRASLLSSTSPISVRSPEAVTVPRHAGFEAQWSAIKGNEHGVGRHGEFLTSPKGAVGPAQVMPGTAPYAAKLAGLPWDEQRYRGDAAYNEALGKAYYAEQLQTFGDPAMAAAAYNAGPGSTRRGTGLRGAIKRAAEHGEPGNWEAYLPHETQRYVADFRRRTDAADRGAPDPGAVAADPALADLGRAAADADAEAAQLSREQELGGPDDGELHRDLAGDRAPVEPVPVLRRELFANDADWAAAQTAFHQSLNASDQTPASGEGRGGSIDDVAEPLPATKGAEIAPGEASAANERLTVPGYVDAYLRGEGRGDSPHDRELLQFASNNGPAIEEEFRARAAASADPARPLTMAELEEIGRPVNSKLDPLWYAGLNAVHERDVGREPKPLWGLRDRRTGEVVSWGVNRKAVEGEKRKAWEPDQLDLEILPPENVAAELRARAAVAAVRLDDPALKAFDSGGAGRSELVDSLEHDYRMAAADPAKGKRTYHVDDSGRASTLLEIFDELDRDRDAAAAIRACAGGA